jgi:hypothetical protein
LVAQQRDFLVEAESEGHFGEGKKEERMGPEGKMLLEMYLGIVVVTVVRAKVEIETEIVLPHLAGKDHKESRVGDLFPISQHLTSKKILREFPQRNLRCGRVDDTPQR